MSYLSSPISLNCPCNVSRSVAKCAYTMQVLCTDPSPIVQCWLKAVGCFVYLWLDFAFFFQLMSDAPFHLNCTLHFHHHSHHPPTHTNAHGHQQLKPITSYYFVKQQPLWMTLRGVFQTKPLRSKTRNADLWKNECCNRKDTVSTQCWNAGVTFCTNTV